MRDRSEGFDEWIRRDFNPIVEANLFHRGEHVGALPVLSGSISEDATADIMSRMDLELAPDPDIIPTRMFKDDYGLWPSGSEIQISCGIEVVGELRELIPCGRFTISDSDISESGSEKMKLTVSGMDRSSLVSRARFSKAYTVTKGTPVSEAIKEIIQSRIPSMGEDEFQFVSSSAGSNSSRSFSVSTTTIANTDDPWVVCRDMANSIGADLFFDGVGRCVLKWKESVLDGYEWDYSEGEDSNLLSANRKLSSEGSYNGVVVGSSNNEVNDVIFGEAWDTDPMSPTYYDPTKPTESSYGAYPYFYSSEFITTNAQALSAARGMLMSVCGLSEKVSFGAIMHPAQEIRDRVMVRRERLGIDDIMVIDSINRNIGPPTTMNVTVKSRRISSVVSQ